MYNSSVYLTEAPSSIDSSLRAYVNNIDSKLLYANWKQNLVLSYNYLPLVNIKEKLQADRATYMKKMEAEEARLKNLVDNQQITTLLINLNSFKTKLVDNAEKMEKQIAQQKRIVQNLKQIAAGKRQMLKSIKKAKIQKMRQQLQDAGIKSTRDIRQLVRSKATLSTNYARMTSRLNIQQNHTKMDSKTRQNLYVQSVNALLRVRKHNQINQLRQIKQSHMQEQRNYSSVPVKKLAQKEDCKISLENFLKLSCDEILNLLDLEDYNFGMLFQVIR